jgi:hypothetical protein
MNIWLFVIYFIIMLLVLVGVYIYKKRKKQKLIKTGYVETKQVKTKSKLPDPADLLADLERGNQPVPPKIEIPANEAPIEPIILKPEAIEKALHRNDIIIIPGVQFVKPTFEDVVAEGFENVTTTLVALRNEIELLKNNHNGNGHNPVEQAPAKRTRSPMSDEQKKLNAERMLAGRAAKKAQQNEVKV